MADPKPDELVAEIEKIRLRLGATIDELLDRSNPKNIAQRQLDQVKAHFVTDDGQVRFENVVPIAKGVAIAVVGIVVLRKVFK